MTLSKSLALTFCLFLSFFLPINNVFAWNALGHMVVADIAYLNLTPTARAKVDDLVSQLNKEYPEMKLFLNIAYWPDTLRSQRIEAFTHWHYIDNPLTLDGTTTDKSIVDTDNAVWAVSSIKNVVRNDHANPFDRARFLSFLTHIVADLHQPLHTVSLVSVAHPTGDRGGNSYHVGYGDQQSVGLHKAWDEGLGEFRGETSADHAMALSKAITDAYPKSSFGDRINDVSPETWAKDGMQVAKSSVYTAPENKQLTDEYISTGKKVASQQAALAGYRLAALLNQLLV